MGYRLTPLVLAILAGNLHGDMAEPAVLLRSVPVLDVGGDHHDAALVQADGSLAFFLVPALARRAEQELTTSFVRVVDMPVVAASRLEGHVGGEQAAFRIGQRIQERIAGEILGIGGVRRSRAECVDLLELLFSFIPLN